MPGSAEVSPFWNTSPWGSCPSPVEPSPPEELSSVIPATGRICSESEGAFSPEGGSAPLSEDSWPPDEAAPLEEVPVPEPEELDEEEEYHFVGSQEADPMEGKISDESPFGKAMLGKKVGTIVEVEAPIGVVKYQVMDIKK